MEIDELQLRETFSKFDEFERGCFSLDGADAVDFREFSAHLTGARKVSATSAPTLLELEEPQVTTQKKSFFEAIYVKDEG